MAESACADDVVIRTNLVELERDDSILQVFHPYAKGIPHVSRRYRSETSALSWCFDWSKQRERSSS